MLMTRLTMLNRPSTMRSIIRFSMMHSRPMKPNVQQCDRKIVTNLMFPIKRQMSSTNSPLEHQSPNFLREIMLTPRTIPVPRWISPQYYTVTLSEICGHSSFILVAFSYAVDEFLQLRVIAVAGSAVMLCFTYFHPHGRVLWLPFKWNVLFIAINVYRIGKVFLDRYLAEQLSEEMIKVRDAHFYILDPPDFARLVRIGKIETFKEGDLLVEQGKHNAYVRLVIDGEFTVYRDGKLTYKIENGNFISEVGLHAGLLLPGNVVSCCSIVASKPGRTLCWERNELTALLRREKQLRRALKAAISWDIIRKLKGQRKLLQTTLREIEDPAEWTNRRNEQNHHRYTAILQNMLAHPKYLKERKEELEKYRVIHHIGDEQHAKALAVNGWTIEDFERGYKDGAEYEEETENDLQGFLKDLYLRIFG